MQATQSSAAPDDDAGDFHEMVLAGDAVAVTSHQRPGEKGAARRSGEIALGARAVERAIQDIHFVGCVDPACECTLAHNATTLLLTPLKLSMALLASGVDINSGPQRIAFRSTASAIMTVSAMNIADP